MDYGLLQIVCFFPQKILDLFVLNYWGEVEDFGPSGTEGIVGGPFSFPSQPSFSRSSRLSRR